MNDVSGVGGDENAAVAAAIRSGDEATFTRLVGRHRRELQVHCYRMLGSFDDAEDLVQETFLRAWRGHTNFQGRASFRAWLYRIATNACLDHLDRHPRTPRPRQAPSGIDAQVAGSPEDEVTWLQPYPDRLLDPPAPREAEPDAAVISKETIELAFLIAIQYLPPRQRAVLILRDVLGWPAKDTAGLLDTSVAAVNSALQRARPVLKERLPSHRRSSAEEPGQDEGRTLLRRYIDAFERSDPDALAELLRDDVLLTMPPEPHWWHGRSALMSSLSREIFAPGAGDLRVLPAGVNRQPAAALYLRRPGTASHRAQGLNILRIEDGRVAEITAFYPDRFPSLGLPMAL